MGRTVSSDLQNLLDLGGCESQPTLDLHLADTSEYFFSTREITIGAKTYEPNLRQCDELKQTLFTPPDRVTVAIQNVDKVIGPTVTAEDLVKADGIVGRYYSDPNGNLPAVWVELFRGEVRPVALSESEARLEVLHDLAACGYCVGDWSLAENCQNVFKHGPTCGYAGLETHCNKKRKSLDGCEGRDNERAFNGMEFPAIQVPDVSTNGGGGDIDPPIFPSCPRIDQWVPARGKGGDIEARRAGTIARGHLLFNPLTGQFDKVKTATIVKAQGIWCVSSSAGVTGFSSFTHPVFPYRAHVTGIKVSEIFDGDPLLLWRRRSMDIFNHSVLRSFYTGTIGDVVRIELESGHIYAYGDNEELFIVCHNAKPIDL